MSRDTLTAASRIIGFVVLLATLLGMSYAGGVIVWRDLLGFETQAAHDADMQGIEQKLDCALFNLPVGCRQTLSPRSTP